MNAEEIVLALATRLPRFTDEFSTIANITSLTRSNTTVTAITDSPHGLRVGQAVNITGALTPIRIESLTRVLGVATLVTDQDHDITFGVPNTVVIEGATESIFNGEFQILSVPNRRAITFAIENSGPIEATGDPLLINGSSPLQQYNGLHGITTVSAEDTFTYEVDNTSLFSPAFGTIKAKANARISAAVSLERLFDAYDEKPQSENWLFVVLDDTVASKRRFILSDATDNTQRQEYFRQQLVEGVNLFLFVPTKQQIAARQARDLAQNLFRPICQSILFERFDTGLFSGHNNALQFVSHGFQAYNTGYYVHRYSFEQVADLLFEDSIGHSEDVAFRDIQLNIKMSIGTQVDQLVADINLDDEPLDQ